MCERTSTPTFSQTRRRFAPSLVGLVLISGCGRLGFSEAQDSNGSDSFRPSNAAQFGDQPLGNVEITQFRWLSSESGELYDGGGTQDRAPGMGINAGISFELVPMADGRSLGVFVVESLTIRSGGQLRAKGANSIAILARGDIVVEQGSFVDATGQGSLGGPGGAHGGDINQPATGCGAGGDGLADTLTIEAPPDTDGGGAGGSYATRGADGGTHVFESEIGRSRPPCGPSFEPLQGGSGGGAGGLYMLSPALRIGGLGGGGGGGLQLSARGRITIAGDVSVSGGGGGDGLLGPPGGASDWGGGGGGGSGGTLLVEAPEVNIQSTAWLTANGGGGGADVGTRSSPASLDGTPAQGTPGLPGWDMFGGNGCAGTIAATRGVTDPARDGVGGGGGCGAIRLLTASGELPAGNTSPVASAGAIGFD
ncbi:MAG: hypothetical protein ACKV2T_09045 [Kofleriaceae bacterium]